MGYFFSTFLSGLLVQRVPAKTVIVTGLVIGAASVSLFGRWPSPWINLGLNLGVGLCQGSIELVANLEIIHMEREGQSRLMNLLHATFCIGAIGGPAAVGIHFGQGRFDALRLPRIAGLLLLVMAVLFATTRFPRASQQQGTRGGFGAGDLHAPTDPGSAHPAAPVYVGTEIGVSSWSSEYFVQVLGSAASRGAYAVALVGTGLLVGRLAVSFWYKGTRQEVLMLALSALSAAMLLVVLLVHSTVAVVIALFLTGLGFSGIYPLAMSLVGRYYKSGVAVGTAATGGAAGSIMFPFLMSILAQTIGIRGGFWFYLGLNCLLVVLTGLLVRLVRRRVALPGIGGASRPNPGQF